jgi:hypothetical protein
MNLATFSQTKKSTKTQVLVNNNNSSKLKNKDKSLTKTKSSEKTKIMTQKNDKLVILQMMFHLWGNTNSTNKMNGSAAENGVTKFKDINDKALKELKKFGYSHLYMTGLIEHATMEDLTALGIPKDHPDVVKGRSGSPFAIKDYYDVNPFLPLTPTSAWRNLRQWWLVFTKMV